MRFLLVCAATWVVACTLINQEPPNAPPTLSAVRVDTLQVRRGAKVHLEISASDQDYDPLFFDWQAYRLSPEILDAIARLSPTGLVDQPDQLRSLYGFLAVGQPVGGFADSSAQVVNSWFAPRSIDGAMERFLLVVAVRDRDCSVISDPAELASCTTGESQFAQVFTVTVTQRPPTLVAPADTVVSFREPSFALVALVSDPDQDPLRVDWQRVSGPEITFSVDALRGASRLQAVAFYPGDYVFGVRVSDGADSVSAQAHVRVHADPPPEGGSVHLLLADGIGYEIDRYEFPNQLGAYPMLTDNWFAAAQQCASQGKRLCTRAEWLNACQGRQMRPFSSAEDHAPAYQGESFGYRFCNTAGSASAVNSPTPSSSRAPSGSYPNCASDYGVYDLTGNVREWLGQMDADGRMVGGISESDVQDAPPDSCSRISRFAPLPAGFDYLAPNSLQELPVEYSDGYLQFSVGFRCCRSDSR